MWRISPRKRAARGAIGDYIRRAWGPTAGVGVLGIYVLSLLFSGAAGFTIAVGELFSRFTSLYFGTDFPWWLAAVALAFAAWWINVRGASFATGAQLALYGTLVPFPGWPERFGLLAGLASIAGTALWLWILRRRGLV